MSPSTRPPTSHSTRPVTSQSTRPTTSHSARPLTSRSTAGSTSYQYAYSDSASQQQGHRQSVSRAGSRPSTRSRRAGSAIGGGESQQIICAVSEARGVSPTVGLAFVNISTGEAVLSQICDNQFYVRTCHKIQVFEPTEILIMSTSSPPNPKSKMYSVIEEEIIGSRITALDRRYWSENAGLDYIQQLAFSEDVEAIKVAIGGNYFATCCLAAVGSYLSRAPSA
jgi:DNA mismatch repair protein MSH4